MAPMGDESCEVSTIGGRSLWSRYCCAGALAGFSFASDALYTGIIGRRGCGGGYVGDLDAGGGSSRFSGFWWYGIALLVIANCSLRNLVCCCIKPADQRILMTALRNRLDEDLIQESGGIRGLWVGTVGGGRGRFLFFSLCRRNIGSGES